MNVVTWLKFTALLLALAAFIVVVFLFGGALELLVGFYLLAGAGVGALLLLTPATIVDNLNVIRWHFTIDASVSERATSPYRSGSRTLEQANKSL